MEQEEAEGQQDAGRSNEAVVVVGEPRARDPTPWLRVSRGRRVPLCLLGAQLAGLLKRLPGLKPELLG